MAPEDPAATASAVEALLAHPERAADLATRARGEVEDYTWPSVRAAWMSAYTGRART